MSLATGLGLAFIMVGVAYAIATVGERDFNLLLGLLTVPFGFAFGVLLLLAFQYFLPGVIQ